MSLYLDTPKSTTSHRHGSTKCNADPLPSPFGRKPLLTTSVNRPATASPHKRVAFNPVSPTPQAAKSLLSPKFDVVKSDWLSEQATRTCSPGRRRLVRTLTADRFIPSRALTAHRLHDDAPAPAASASPETYIRAQTSKYYKSSVAVACGLDMNQRILQFQPAPPERKPTIDLLGRGVQTVTRTLKPSIVAARARKVPTSPERVLDAPGIVDDFYLNLLSWSPQNLLSIALELSIYIWNASTGHVGFLTETDVLVSSLRWLDDGCYLSIGKENGSLEVWDIESNSKLRTMKGSDDLTRLLSHCWSSHLITSGSRAGNIVHHDVRVLQHAVQTITNAHKAEVCGLEWRADGMQFALGGNDNVVHLWDARAAVPRFSKTAHNAAVKALAWCPTQTSLLATGGGSTDKYIHFWNTTTGARVNSIDTGSQISSLKWGYSYGTGQEIMATHGYPDNSIGVYSYPTLQKTGEIVRAHDSRILHSALSPDGTTVATTSGDENLKFWKVWDLPKARVGGESTLAENDKQMRKVMTIR
ncbi:hypothetical protein BABINDRAFT_162590 [Babjeviella inositovora NRRL Y-12698]|uniref:CDC20/Fizzy WD40 domain-containing protein n=1 Tax=Babjeviella inositovora NRRL Y-12698 TaxID=984486 RepID=A0A1E3QNB6_9ASCO|nr:uncharacterized protein BABINDRAFT_162590 [Babjeviella inositovora NRRL Y-12698]ODQ78934.1 hypothetical protein BABINDRAFT_162590 [Babjeviella inositovora NRRL Y-12698]